jgi:FkbM family methyltransferase
MKKHINDISTQPCGYDLVLYGFGAIGEFVLNELINQGVRIDHIIDKNKVGQSYKGIQILDIETSARRINENSRCLVTLHNHYVDLGEIYNDLARAGFSKIYSLVNLPKLVNTIHLPSSYWLDYRFNYDNHSSEITKLFDIFADEKSRCLLNNILEYRKSGILTSCPEPSLYDEYTPEDLPRYSQPLRLIDCGACTGLAIYKFKNKGYVLDGYIAFEPDKSNYEKLVSRNHGLDNTIILPLGTWSDNLLLRFSAQASMGSSINEDGDCLIQCVKIDSAIRGFKPNIIKFDVEGAEFETIMGAKYTIEEYRPNLCISVYHKPDHLFTIPLLIHSFNLNYKFYLRVHEYNTFGVVLYCLQEDQIQS